MNITIVGTGNMAHGIGTRIAASDHSLIILGRNAEEAKVLAEKLGNNVKSDALSELINGDIIIFTLPYLAIPEIIEKYKEQLIGKILVDISNPVDFKTFELIPPAGSSGVEEIAKNLPKDARMVKAFNTTFAGTLVTGSVDGKKLDVFVASDDENAAQTVVKLAVDCGLRGLYVGPLKRARALEGFQLIHMAMQEKLGTNWMSTIKILP